MLTRRKSAVPFLVGTKYDQFATFSRDEQEEITRQVSLAVSTTLTVSGKALRESDEGAAHLLLDLAIDQRAKGAPSVTTSS